MAIRRRLFVFFLVLFSASIGLFAEESDHKYQWKLEDNYTGQHQASFKRLSFEIPQFMRQTMIDMAVKLGMNFEEGWQYPLIIRFIDTSPTGVENVLAYVQMGQTSDGSLVQLLNINLQAYDDGRFDYKKVFTHELVHAMFNDALGGNAALKIPVWLHEGLAVYGADQGEKMVKAYVYDHSGFAESQLLNGLEGPHTAWDYAEDYLAIKYIVSAHGTNSFHNFIRETIKREGDYKAALSYTCYESWDEFQVNAKKFAVQEIHRIGPTPARYDRKPY